MKKTQRGVSPRSSGCSSGPGRASGHWPRLLRPASLRMAVGPGAGAGLAALHLPFRSEGGGGPVARVLSHLIHARPPARPPARLPPRGLLVSWALTVPVSAPQESCPAPRERGFSLPLGCALGPRTGPGAHQHRVSNWVSCERNSWLLRGIVLRWC